MVSVDEVEQQLAQLNGANKLYFTAQNEEEKRAANQQFVDAWKWFQEVAGLQLELDTGNHTWVLADEGPTFFVSSTTDEITLKELREHNIAFSRQKSNIKVVFPPGTRQIPRDIAKTYDLITPTKWRIAVVSMLDEHLPVDKSLSYSSVLVIIDQKEE